MDQLKGEFYLRIFGNEILYNKFEGLQRFIDRNGFNVLDMLISMSKNNDYRITQNIMFLDTSMVIPTSAGFSLNLMTNGAAALDFKALGKMDLRNLALSPRSFHVNGHIQTRFNLFVYNSYSFSFFIPFLYLSFILFKISVPYMFFLGNL